MVDDDQKEKKCSGSKIWKEGKCRLPEVTFTAFVMSLNSSALYHLGEISDPATGKKETDPVLAKHTIDTLDLLEKKTKGNLTEDEFKILQDVVYDLKMRYLKLID